MSSLDPIPDVSEASAHEPRRVLVIDDDDDFRSLVTDSLRAAGYDVIEAADGRVALLQFEPLAERGLARLPDIIVSDVRMPWIDGMDLVRLLREAGWSVPVVLMSGFADVATSAEWLGLGASVVLDKPFSMARLREVVGKYVAPQPWQKATVVP
jgi:DNA-binding response OmpR family regulator